MKLRTKVQLFLSIGMIIVILLVNSAVYFLYENRVRDNEIERVREDAHAIMEAIANQDEINLDYSQLLKAFSPVNGMVRIIDKTNKEIYFEANDASYQKNWPYEYTEKEVTTINHTSDDTPYVQVSIPIIWNDGSIVTLQVSEALYSMKDALSRLQVVLFITSLFMLIPAIIAGIIIARYVTTPIKKLTREISSNPKNGKWEKISITKNDKDEIAEMQLAYNHMIDRIDENMAKQTRFVSDASHELKTPLSVITSYAELLQRRGKERAEIFDEAVDAILSEAGRMKQLTGQMLMLAKNEMVENVRFQPVNITNLIRDVVRSLSMAYNRQIHLYEQTEITDMVSADEQKLYQAVYILVDNACKYSDKEINLSLEEKNGQLLISVQDFGDGLSEEDQQLIFDRFYRVDKARSRKAGGTGLGLAICKAIIEAHGGRITIDSKLKEGSTFTIEIPK
ncbi:HAMP domain-containing histidine kinase [Gracilibacillus oryzae]|uniref:Signal transduction histidine-protein kinase ArlS n=1 Tax=Gracilibacillus oryzae TaxID=1672701 RepID=A0A7C8GVP3_9BACI|nr:ATP-binding protein [Gracilibacillus oryzae]KAB8138919.1 HAMP domain-containing histidine kinase [Gracilibacillus oryzae]